MESSWNCRAGGLGGTQGLEMPYHGWSERLSTQPDTAGEEFGLEFGVLHG